MPAMCQWPDEAIITACHLFYQRHGCWPTRRDFTPARQLPSLTVVTRRMRTWEEPVRQAQAQLKGGA